MPDYLKIILLFLAWISIAVWCHVRIKEYYRASLIASLCMMALTQLMGYIELGELDPLWFIGALTSFFMGAIVALLVGLPFRLVRKLDKKEPD